MLTKMLRSVDTLIYLFIVPFGVLYVFPRAFLFWEMQLGIELPQYPSLDFIGAVLMNAGGALALWCTLLMYFHSRDSISPLQKPKSILSSGPYRVVRHPMMWSLNLVLIGEILTYSSPAIALWLIIWVRFAAVYIARYEEPYLQSVFGESYADYCRKTPRWVPFAAMLIHRMPSARV